MELWVGCVAGALGDAEYADKLQAAGFVDVEVDPWRIYQLDDARAFLAETGLNVEEIASQMDGRVASAFIRARKPEAKACCGPTCCS
jgi:arsenite methyltransferase